MQELADRHDTPFRALGFSSDGLGLDTIDQVVPFHDSTRGCGSSSVPMNEPTAVQELAETHDTAARLLVDPSAGLGTTDHLVPFHDSTRGFASSLKMDG